MYRCILYIYINQCLKVYKHVLFRMPNRFIFPEDQTTASSFRGPHGMGKIDEGPSIHSGQIYSNSLAWIKIIKDIKGDDFPRINHYPFL